MAAPRSRSIGAVVAAVAVLALAVGCSSSGDRPTLPTTTTASGGSSTSTSRETTTTTERTTTTTEPRTTTTTGDGPTTTSTTRPSTTTTTRPATTTTKAKDTTTTSAAAGTTTTASGIASDTIASGSSDFPWLALAALAAVLILVLVVALRRRSERKSWWDRADALVRDGRALVDVGSAGPAGADPQQQVAHWGTLEQRTQALANEITAVLGSGPPDDATRASVAGLGQAVSDYVGALRTSRTLRIGPPAPTAEQLQFADAESNQRLAVVRANLDQLEQLVVPHRTTA